MTDREEKLAKQIEEIQKLAAQNKEVDAAALALNLLQNERSSSLPVAQKRRAYLVSLLLPPFGAYYVFKFWLRAENDARRVAWICLAITAVSFLILYAMGSALLSNPQIEQIQQINPQDIYELTQ